MGTMNWKEEAAKSGTRKVYPSGTYKVVVDEWEECEASTGTKQIRWFNKIVLPEEYKGEKLVDHTPLTENALWRVAKLISSCGVDISQAPSMEVMSESFKDILDMVKGRAVWLNIRHDEQYNNNKVEDYVAVETSEQEAIAYAPKEDTQVPF